MKKLTFYVCLAILLLSLATVLTGCIGGGGEGGTTTGTEYRISFSVDGTVTTLDVKAGSMPSFTGSTEKAPDIKGKKYYAFTGWDKPLAAATENTTYTAQYEEMPLCTVMWDVQGGLQKSYTGEGMLPTPPANALEDKLTNDKVRTFVRWDKEITAATTGTNLYKAIYTDATRYYTISFRVNGTEVATGRSEYNQPAYKAYPGGAKVPAGYGDIMWLDGTVKVQKDNLVVNGAYVAQNGASLTTSYAADLMGYDSIPADLIMNDNSGAVYAQATAVLYMLYEIRTTQNADATTQLLVDRCVESLKHFVDPNTPSPCFDLAPTWSYVPMSAAITIAKETPAVWNKLSASDKERLSFIMEVMAYVLTLGTDDENKYTTGPGMMGNYNKTWNPNYRLANVVPMLFIGRYFGGAAKVNQMLHAFSFDATVAKFQQYGFARAYANWTKPNPTNPDTGATLPGPKQFMENGGPAYTKKRNDSTGTRLGITEGKAAGSGVGVRTDYTYNQKNIDNVAGIMEVLLNYNYSGGNVRSDWDLDADGKADAYILDGTRSPYEGKAGMMLEFGNGGRSSASYCKDDFLMVVTALFALEELGMYDVTSNRTLAKKVWVGNQDFLYKYSHGYHSTSGYSTQDDHRESTAADYLLWKEVWQTGLGALTYEQIGT